MRSVDRKLHNTIARETKSKVTFSCLLKMRAIGSVITHNTCNVSHKQKLLFSFIFKKHPVEILLYKILEPAKHGCLKGPKWGHLVSALQVKLIPHTSVTSHSVNRDNCLWLPSPAGILISLNLPKKLIFGHYFFHSLKSVVWY